LLLFIAEIQGILYLPKRDHIFWPILYGNDTSASDIQHTIE